MTWLLASGAELAGLAGLLFAGRGKILEDLVRIIDWGRHQLRRLAAGVTEHDALVARAFVLVAGAVHALRDIGGLGMQQDFDLGVFPVETVLLVPDVLDGGARHVFDPLRIDDRPTDLAGDHDPVCRRKRLAGDADAVGIDAGLRTLTEEQVDDLVGDAVADLVGMSFRHGFTREEVIRARHCSLRVNLWTQP